MYNITPEARAALEILTNQARTREMLATYDDTQDLPSIVSPEIADEAAEDYASIAYNGEEA